MYGEDQWKIGPWYLESLALGSESLALWLKSLALGSESLALRPKSLLTSLAVYAAQRLRLQHVISAILREFPANTGH